MKYPKSSGIQGAWAKAGELSNISSAVIVTEAKPHPSNYTNKDGSPKFQDVAKVKFEGIADELNVSLNRPTINALIDAFGEDSVGWMNKPLGVETEKVKVAGKSVVALYLVPAGYEKIDNAEGYTVIIKKDDGSQPAPSDEIPTINIDEEPVEGIGGPVPF